MFRKNFFLITIIYLLALSPIFSGCKDFQKTEETIKKVVLNEVVRSIFFAPQYVAITQGLFMEEGLDIELNTSWDRDKSTIALVSKTADISLMGSETAIYLLKKNSQEKIINFAQLNQTDGSFLLSREKIENFTWDDLRGKIIIGGHHDSIPQMVMEYVLNKKNIKPHHDVDIIQNIAFKATRAAFKGGIGDFIQLLEPNASTLEKEGLGHVVASFSKETDKIAYTVFMATESYIKENPDTIQKFTNAIYKGQIWCSTHTAEEIAKAIKLFFPEDNLEIITTAVQRYKEQNSWAPNPLVQKEAIDRLQEIMISENKLDEKAPYEMIINNTFAEKAVKDIPLPVEEK